MTYYVDYKGQVTLIKRPSKRTHQKSKSRTTSVVIKQPKLKPV